MEIKGYTLCNDEKIHRAIHGSMGAEGKLVGGVGEDDEDKILTEYDRLGGLIKKGKYKVKTGSFWDHVSKKARTKPDVTLTFRDVEGNEVEVPEGEPMPIEARVAEAAAAKRANPKAKGVAKEGKKKAPAKDATDETEE